MRGGRGRIIYMCELCVCVCAELCPREICFFGMF